MPKPVTRDEERGTRILCIASVWGLFLTACNITVAATAPDGSFDNSSCISCHEKHDNELVRAWRASVHGKDKPVADCVACHGDSHKGAAVKARQDETCIDCHGDVREPTVHSYASSKHGLILKLEKKEWDWTQPLAQANYRTPGCAYCHMHSGEHNVSATVRGTDLLRENSKEIKSVQDATRRVCQDCHAPRYLSRLFENGERMLAIARMKVREAKDLLLQMREQYTLEELDAAAKQYEKMQSVHLKNVYLGIAHQSPDYQWWYGQPALDGDLLRIKGAISELIRIKSANEKQKACSPGGVGDKEKTK